MIAKAICTEAIIQRPAIRCAPRARRAAPTRARSARRARPSGPSSCRAGSRRPTATPRPASRCRPACPWRSAVIRRRTRADPPGHPDEERQQRERDQRQPPVEQEHRDRRRQHRGHVGDDRGGGGRDHGLHAADVVGDPRLHLAGAGAREERQREPLQVAVDRSRRSCMTCWPTGSTAASGRRRSRRWRSGSRSSRPPAASRSPGSRSGIALSSRSRSRNGGTIPSAAEISDHPQHRAQAPAVGHETAAGSGGVRVARPSRRLHRPPRPARRGRGWAVSRQDARSARRSSAHAGRASGPARLVASRAGHDRRPAAVSSTRRRRRSTRPRCSSRSTMPVTLDGSRSTACRPASASAAAARARASGPAPGADGGPRTPAPRPRR